MKNKGKKILALAMATTLIAAAFAGCKDDSYKGDAISYVKGEVTSNGGFVVEEGNYVYFINGQENYTANNEYGEVVKGALMRVDKADFEKGDFTKVKTIVPSLFVAQNFDAGIYIYDGSVYYATPTTDKNLSGQVENSWLDFKRAKLDGSAAPEDYFFRLSSNSAKYRFVKDNGKVYCLYEDGGALKSYNVSTKKTTTLVKNASSFYYDTTNAESPLVYYTMNVVVDAETDKATTADYNQVYCVSASATVKQVNASAAKYTTSYGYTYDFNEAEMKADNKEAKDNKQDEPYNFSDYTTYPYVNLGKLVLDGVGSSDSLKETQFNTAGKTGALTPYGYTYTISSYQNGGIYFTRSEVVKTSSDGENTKLYYLADAKTQDATWNAVTGNKGEFVETVAQDTTNTGSAVFYLENNKHYYLYLSDSSIKKAALGEETVDFKNQASGATLWKIQGNYLYYFSSSTNGNGNGLSRINYKGDQTAYDLATGFESEEYAEYKATTFAGVDWNSSWYKPEFVGDTLVYSNEQSFGKTTYGHIYVTEIPATQAAMQEATERYDAAIEAIEDTEDSDLKAAYEYYFRTGERTAFDAAYKKDKFDDDQKKAFDEFVARFSATEDKLYLENTFIQRLGKVTASDKNAIAQAWTDSLEGKEDETTTDDSLPGWAIALIIAGGVIVVAAAVLVPVLVISAKKRKKAQEDEATVNAYKRKIDTTDDKSIDVYADEEETAEETVVEEATEVVPETETVEEAVEETAQEPAVETTEEAEAVEVTEVAETAQEDENKAE